VTEAEAIVEAFLVADDCARRGLIPARPWPKAVEVFGYPIQNDRRMPHGVLAFVHVSGAIGVSAWGRWPR